MKLTSWALFGGLNLTACGHCHPKVRLYWRSELDKESYYIKVLHFCNDLFNYKMDQSLQNSKHENAATICQRLAPS